MITVKTKWGTVKAERANLGRDGFNLYWKDNGCLLPLKKLLEEEKITTSYITNEILQSKFKNVHCSSVELEPMLRLFDSTKKPSPNDLKNWLNHIYEKLDVKPKPTRVEPERPKITLQEIRQLERELGLNL